MQWYQYVLAVLAASDAALATPTFARRSPYVVKEDHPVPPKWTKIGVPQPEHMVDLAIGFKNKKFAELERHLYEVSDPFSTRYGMHLSNAEVDALQRPDSRATTDVVEWLESHGIMAANRKHSSAGNWINIKVPVSKVEEMLNTVYSTYMHEDGDLLARAPTWSLPRHLHDHIATIQPTSAFLRAAPQINTIKELPSDYDVSVLDEVSTAADYSSPASIQSACNFTMVTTNCLRTLYNTINYKPRAGNKNAIGFTNYLGQATSRSDAATFLQKNRPEAVSTANTYREISIDGGPVSGSTAAGVEADLDVETILGIVYPVPVTSYSTGGSPPFTPDLNTPTNTNEPYLTWLNYVSNRTDVPQTISTSYGDDEQTVPQSYAETVCQGLAALGAKGHTLLFSSGDSGVGSNDTCLSNDGKSLARFLPAFPASCPYVTTVGATKNYPEVVAYDPANGFASGAGFSNYFGRPKYQDAVVPGYVAGLRGKYDGLYNKSGRAYPDVAANGVDYAIVYSGRVVAVDGTSCSSPTTASVLSLVNDALIAAGKAPLGFLNPLLYSGLGAKSFNDITSGSSIGCNVAGFTAGKGWDAASGWGTPDFVKILNALGLTP